MDGNYRSSSGSGGYRQYTGAFAEKEHTGAFFDTILNHWGGHRMDFDICSFSDHRYSSVSGGRRVSGVDLSISGNEVRCHRLDHAACRAGVQRLPAGEYCISRGIVRNTMRLVYIFSIDKSSPVHSRKTFVTALLILLFSAAIILPAGAVGVEQLLDTEELEAALPPEAYIYMPPSGISNLDLSSAVEKLESLIREKTEQTFASAMKTAGILLLVCISIALADTLDQSGGTPQYVLFAGVAAIGAAALEDFDYYLNLGTGSLRSIDEYSKVLLPCLASAAAASGSVSGSTAKYAATAFFMNLLTHAADTVIVPGICAYAALSVADGAVGNQALKTAKKLLKSICFLLLTGMCLAFTSWIAFSGIIADSADAVTARMAKTAVSTALPVVGGILSDAAGSLAAAAGALKCSIGAYGAMAVLCICVGPFIVLSVRYTVFKVSAALCGCVSDKRLTDLVNDLSTCLGMILALNGAAALMMFLSVYSLIRTVI